MIMIGITMLIKMLITVMMMIAIYAIFPRSVSPKI